MQGNVAVHVSAPLPVALVPLSGALSLGEHGHICEAVVVPHNVRQVGVRLSPHVWQGHHPGQLTAIHRDVHKLTLDVDSGEVGVHVRPGYVFIVGRNDQLRVSLRPLSCS